MRGDRIGAREQFLDFLRSRVSRDVDVFRRGLAHHVADAATGKEGDVVVFAQFCCDDARRFFHCLHSYQFCIARACRATLPGCQLGIGRRESLPYNFVFALFTLDSGFWRKVWMMKQITAIQMQESATLKAGQGSAKRTCKLTRRKSMTWPWVNRSVRLPNTPAR